MREDKNQFGFKTIINEFLNAFNVERGIFPTIRDLLIRPNMVVNHYIEGKQLLEIYKEKYFLPGRFFVTIFFIIGIFSFFFGESVLTPNLDSSTGFGKFFEERSDLNWLDAFVEKYIMFIVVISGIIPYTFATKLIFIKRQEYTLSMYFVMNIYFQCLILLASPILLLFVDTIEEFMTMTNLVYFLYYAFAFKKVFHLTFWKSILYGGFFVHLISVFIIMLTGFLVGFSSSAIQHLL